MKAGMLMICLMIASWTSQAAGIYKCVDEMGHVTFSQSRCSTDAKAVDVQTREPTAAELQAAQERNEAANRFVDERVSERQAARLAAEQRKLEDAITLRAELYAREAQDRRAAQESRLRAEQASRRMAEQDNARREEQKNKREVENTLRRETALQNAGVMGRDVRYDRAAEACRRTPGANCQ
jgi:hypothetical protein